MKKIAIFVDGSNFGAGLKAAGFYVDYIKLRDYFAQRGDLVGMYYFTALPPSNERSPIRSFTDSLQHKGWTVVTKEVKTSFSDDGFMKEKGNMDIELVVKAFVLQPHITDLILCSGDGDFRAMVEELQNRGIRVTCVSHQSRGSNNMIAEELRKQVNEFIPVAMIRTDIESKTKPMSQRKRDFLDGR